MDTILPGLDGALNLHPFFVHSPLALWPTALLFLGLGYVRERGDLFRFGTWLLYLGLLGALAAGLSGWLAADALGHDQPGHHLVHTHRNFMLAALGLASLAAGAAHWARSEERRGRRWVPTGLLLLASLVMGLGADRGAQLVYQYGIGVREEAPPAADEGHGAHGGGDHHH